MLPKQTRLWRVYLTLADALDRPWGIDGRFVIVICLLLYFGALARCISLFHNDQACWLSMGSLEPLPVTAADLVILPSTARSVDEGADPYSPSPYDPMFRVEHYSRAFNYPRIWLLLPRLGLTEANVGIWRSVMCAIFFLSVLTLFGKMNWFSGLIAGAAVCSPSIMYGVERGNVDQWVFIIFAVAVLCFKRQSSAIAGYTLLLFAAILKLYPALSFITILRERTWKRRAIIASVLTITFAAYLYSIRADLRSIARVTPHDHHLAFGREVFFMLIDKWILHGASGAAVRWLSLASFVLLAVCLGLAFWMAVQLRSYWPGLISGNQPFLTAFQIGAITFVGVYCVATSFNYRLVFLLLTVPQILSWIRERNLWGAISSLGLVALMASLWPAPQRSGLNPVIVGILFVYLVAALLLTLPDDIGSLVFGRPRRANLPG